MNYPALFEVGVTHIINNNKFNKYLSYEKINNFYCSNSASIFILH